MRWRTLYSVPMCFAILVVVSVVLRLCHLWSINRYANSMLRNTRDNNATSVNIEINGLEGFCNRTKFVNRIYRRGSWIKNFSLKTSQHFIISNFFK